MLSSAKSSSSLITVFLEHVPAISAQHLVWNSRPAVVSCSYRLLPLDLVPGAWSYYYSLKALACCMKKALFVEQKKIAA